MIVARKEATDTLRDRRTWVAMILVPILLVPILLLVAPTAAMTQMESVAQSVAHVAVVGGDGAQGFLDFLHEQALAAHLGQRHVEDDVAPGLQHQQFHGNARVLALDAGLDVFGLPQGQLAASGGDDEFLHVVGCCERMKSWACASGRKDNLETAPSRAPS